MTYRLGLLAAVFLFSTPLVAQTTTETGVAQPDSGQRAQVTKDVVAVTLAQRSVSAMTGGAGIVAYRDSMMTGKLTVGGEVPKTFSVVFKTLGTREVRIELTNEEGTRLRTLNGGQAVIQYPNGKIRKLLMNNTLPERVSHLPSFSLLAEASDPSVIIESAGSSKTPDGRTASVVAMRAKKRKKTGKATQKEGAPN